MIRYSLTCGNAHSFDSWFQSADAFDRLAAGGHISCAVCGSGDIAKTLMAPVVRPGRRASVDVPPDAPLSTPQTPVEEAFAEMRRKIEQTSEYVGLNFATEARAIHDGAAPERSIYGEARADEARRLIEDGVPVAPLPFRPARKAN